MFSTNKEAEGRDIDNEIILRVPLEVKAQLSLVGRSTPEQLDYSIRNRTPGLNAIFDSEIGPIVSHLYQVNFSFIAFSAMTLMIYIYIYIYITLAQSITKGSKVPFHSVTAQLPNFHLLIITNNFA